MMIGAMFTKDSSSPAQWGHSIDSRLIDGQAMTTSDNAQRPESRTTLNSWKEIANFFDRGVRTVQRWEQELHLPVHRIGGGKRAPVYAVVSELKFWMATTDGNSPRNQPSAKPDNAANNNRTMQLTARVYELSQAVAESSVRHQRQTEALQKNLRTLFARRPQKPRGS